MNDDLHDTICSLEGFGCTTDEAEALCNLIDAGYPTETIARLKRHRACFLEEMHGWQAKVDHVDFLIRKIEKSRQQSQPL